MNFVIRTTKKYGDVYRVSRPAGIQNCAQYPLVVLNEGNGFTICVPIDLDDAKGCFPENVKVETGEFAGGIIRCDRPQYRRNDVFEEKIGTLDLPTMAEVSEKIAGLVGYPINKEETHEPVKTEINVIKELRAVWSRIERVERCLGL